MKMRTVGVGLAPFLVSVALGCGDPRPSDPPDKPADVAAVVAALAAAAPDPNDRTHAGRAAYYAARAAAYRDYAAKARQLSAVYAARPAKVVGTPGTDLDAALKAQVEAQATSLDAIAVDIQSLADYHTAAAANGGAQ